MGRGRVRTSAGAPALDRAKGRATIAADMHEEFIFRDDFKKWLIWSKFALPAFWYGNEETDTGDAKAGEAHRQ